MKRNSLVTLSLTVGLLALLSAWRTARNELEEERRHREDDGQHWRAALDLCRDQKLDVHRQLEQLQDERQLQQDAMLAGPFALHLEGGLLVSGPLATVEDVYREAEALSALCPGVTVYVLAPIGTVETPEEHALWDGDTGLLSLVEGLGARF